MTAPDLLLDCDTGIDDAMAILYAGRHGGERLQACTVTHGNVPVNIGARNTLTTLDVAGLHSVPVFVGAHRPLAQPSAPLSNIHGLDGLGDAGVEMSPRASRAGAAAVEIIARARVTAGGVVLVAVGPLTNLALALVLEPALPQFVRRVVVMGGAVGHAGNVTETAEANIWRDPEAAQLVLEAPWDVTVVGLETTMANPLPQGVLDRIEKAADPRARFLWAILQSYLDFHQPIFGRRTCVAHDAVAMAIALDPGLAICRHRRVFVETGPGRTRGSLIADLRPNASPVPLDPAAGGVMGMVDEFDINAFHARLLESVGA